MGVHWGISKSVEDTSHLQSVKIVFFPPIIFISWRLITLQYCSGFCHTLTWISHGFTCVPHPESPPTFLPIPSLWVIPVHQPQALVSCIQPGLVICFTLDNIHVSILFSQIIPPSPSSIESKSLSYVKIFFKRKSALTVRSSLRNNSWQLYSW